MAIDSSRIGSKNVVDGSPIVMSDTNPELVFLSPKNVLVTSGGIFTFDKYLGDREFAIIEGSDLEDFPEAKDTVQLTDIESISYEQYLLEDGSKKVRAILKIRNSSKTKEDVIGVDARIANLGAKS
jgi:hypothetical protein